MSIPTLNLEDFLLKRLEGSSLLDIVDQYALEDDVYDFCVEGKDEEPALWVTLSKGRYFTFDQLKKYRDHISWYYIHSSFFSFDLHYVQGEVKGEAFQLEFKDELGFVTSCLNGHY